MKKRILNLSAVALIAAVSVLTGCKKDDTTAPVVTITGTDKTVSLQGTYTEEGATAEDNKDGKLNAVVGGDVVDVNRTGTYNVVYTATDAAGNVGTAKRVVTVVNDADYLTGSYNCTITGAPPTYTQTVTASTTKNNRIGFGKFSNYVNNINIYADVAGTTITLPSQTAIAVGSPAADRVFAGTGHIVTGGFSMNYTETTGGTTTPWEEFFVKL